MKYLHNIVNVLQTIAANYKFVNWEVSIVQPGIYDDTDTDTSEALRHLGKYEVQRKIALQL